MKRSARRGVAFGWICIAASARFPGKGKAREGESNKCERTALQIQGERGCASFEFGAQEVLLLQSSPVCCCAVFLLDAFWFIAKQSKQNDCQKHLKFEKC